MSLNSATMTMNSSVEGLLKELEVDRAKALLLWYLEDANIVDTTSKTVQALVDEVNRLDAATAYNALSDLKVEDLVRFSVVNEFGEGFSRKKSYEFLIAATVERFAIAAAVI